MTKYLIETPNYLVQQPKYLKHVKNLFPVNRGFVYVAFQSQLRIKKDNNDNDDKDDNNNNNYKWCLLKLQNSSGRKIY